MPLPPEMQTIGERVNQLYEELDRRQVERRKAARAEDADYKRRIKELEKQGAKALREAAAAPLFNQEPASEPEGSIMQAAPPAAEPEPLLCDGCGKPIMPLGGRREPGGLDHVAIAAGLGADKVYHVGCSPRAGMLGAGQPPQEGMHRAGPMGEQIPEQPEGQSMTWFQWVRATEGVIETLAAQLELDVDFEVAAREPFLSLYRRGLKPSEAARKYLVSAPERAAAAEPSPEPDTQKCRVCGCTELNCAGCIEKTGEPCHWTEEDLCSACAVLEELPMDRMRKLAKDWGYPGFQDNRTLLLEFLRKLDEANDGGVTRSAMPPAEDEELSPRQRTIAELAEELRPLMADPNVNDHGVYTKGVRVYKIGGLKKGDSIEIRAAQSQVDKLWRLSHAIQVGPGGTSSAPSVTDVGLESLAYGLRTQAQFILHWLEHAEPGHHEDAKRVRLNAAITAVGEWMQSNPHCQVKTDQPPAANRKKVVAAMANAAAAKLTLTNVRIIRQKKIPGFKPQTARQFMSVFGPAARAAANDPVLQVPEDDERFVALYQQYLDGKIRPADAGRLWVKEMQEQEAAHVA